MTRPKQCQYPTHRRTPQPTKNETQKKKQSKRQTIAVTASPLSRAPISSFSRRRRGLLGSHQDRIHQKSWRSVDDDGIRSGRQEPLLLRLTQFLRSVLFCSFFRHSRRLPIAHAELRKASSVRTLSERTGRFSGE